MQTVATATAPQRKPVDPAFNRLAELKPNQPAPEPEDRRERYFFFAGDFPNCPPVNVNGEKVHVGGTTVDTRCIPDKVLWRCLVTPCTTVPVMTPHYAIPQGRKLHGTDVYDRDRNLVAAQMLEFAGPAANDLIVALGDPHDLERQRGLVEIAPEMLRGKSFEEVREYNITFLFFPNWPYDVPATHAEVRAKIEESIDLLKADSHPLFLFDADPAKRLDGQNRDTHWLKKLYLQAGADMLKAVDQAERWHNSVAERANVDIARGDTDSKHKEGFDSLDEVAFLRTGLIKTTKQMQEMVKASRENRGANDKVADAMVLVAQTLANQQAQPQPSGEVEALRAELAEMRKMIAQQPAPKLAVKKEAEQKG